MKIVIDFDLCQGHAVCMGEAPDVFRVDEDGVLTVLNAAPDEALREAVETAAKYCPNQSITVVEE